MPRQLTAGELDHLGRPDLVAVGRDGVRDQGGVPPPVLPGEHRDLGHGPVPGEHGLGLGGFGPVTADLRPGRRPGR